MPAPIPVSPELPPSPEAMGGEGREVIPEQHDLGGGIERAPERVSPASQDPNQQQPQVFPQPNQASQSQSTSAPAVELESIKARLFQGVDYQHASTDTLVNHLLVHHNMDEKLAHDLVEFLRSEVSQFGKEG